MLGARVIEKHFTLNHTWKGTDHALSLEPIGMQKMIRDLHRARLALGDGVKRSLPIRIECPDQDGQEARRCPRACPPAICSAKKTSPSSRPATAWRRTELDRVVGSRLTVALEPDAALSLEVLDAAGVKA